VSADGQKRFTDPVHAFSLSRLVAMSLARDLATTLARDHWSFAVQKALEWIPKRRDAVPRIRTCSTSSGSQPAGVQASEANISR
jgi:hypothetical protein